MADVLGLPRQASTRGAKRRPGRSRQMDSTGTASNRHARHVTVRQSTARAPERPPGTGRPLARPAAERRPRRHGGGENAAWEEESLDEMEGLHGLYDTVGSIQRGVDMFQPSSPTPDIFMPHLAAHGEFPQHLRLPYNLEHHHPSLYEGAPLIRGFPGHDKILKSMQRDNRENYRGKSR